MYAAGKIFLSNSSNLSFRHGAEGLDIVRDVQRIVFRCASTVKGHQLKGKIAA
jgi:hypothetical protein